ncbi:MAG: endonuclease/exonuclease/phosphatase family protein [Rhodospirillaceae bacterium]|nr:endonuclease/exonuclease/phosphatase family protein [Rhodospirillaceae bacterium]MDD9915579.1 endonuclease/exonuclease/phosphatase family protein [Rhodospirillaceae bacterium]MDD9925432.1 endonuclease/exonuclease/phosphatase family protein [Rhodospirillaceae bacterium]
MRLVAYNIQYGTGKDGRVDIDRIVSEVAEADVIAMQEVDRFWARSEMVDQVAAITERLPAHQWVYGPGVDLDASIKNSDGTLVNRRRQFGNLLLSRHPILASKNRLLPKMRFHTQLSLQRTMLDGVIDCPGGPVRVASIHFAHAAEPERLAQVAALRTFQREAGRDGGVLSGRHANWPEGEASPPWPPQSILLGDFNMSPDEAAYTAMVGPDDPKYGRITEYDGYLDAWILQGGAPDGGHTKYEPTGNRRIDYAFVSPDLAEAVRSVHVDEDAQGSDHQPLWLDIDL